MVRDTHTDRAIRAIVAFTRAAGISNQRGAIRDAILIAGIERGKIVRPAHILRAINYLSHRMQAKAFHQKRGKITLVTE